MSKLGEAEIARIVARAIELGPRERLAYIRVACANDSEAFDRVLLAHSVATQSHPGESDESFWAIDRSGQVLGPWRLLRRLGGGGMSDVYLAERTGDYSHQVAVKLVRPGLVSRADHNRLRAERQILARLNHRNIARLLDGGTTADGIPYLVMEYVDGERIDHYCDRHRLSVTARLALFRGVCAAVHTAHQNLVIHRDLKPSNILVTQDRTLKLLDFGIAKLIEVRETAHTVALTHADVRLFTPGHASPEQVRGELITTMTDIYLLGVLLYELLCGKPPFEVRDMRLSEIERVICNETAPLPSSVVDPRLASPLDLARIQNAAEARQTTPTRLRRELSGDLDNIVMKAMRKETARRYASADELAADLKRYQSGQPVIARRDTWRYRADKFVRRHTMGVGASVLVVLLLAALVAVLAVEAHRIAKERAIAEQARRRSDEVASFLVELFEVADPSNALGREMTAREILERGARRIRQELKGDPETQANLMEAIGRVYQSLGLAAEARPQLEGALAMREKLFPGDHAAKASNLSALGSVELAAGRLDAAQTRYREALDMNERLHGHRHIAVAASLQDMGQLLKVKGDFKGAQAALEESLRLFTELEGPKSSHVSSVMNELAQLMERRGDFAGAEDFYRRALAVDRETLGKDHPQIAHNLHNLAVVLQARGKLAEAGPLFQESIAQLRKVLGEKHPDTLDALGNYGRYLQASGDLAGAEAVLRQVLALNTEVRGAGHPYVGYDHVNLAGLLHVKGEEAGAEEQYREGLKIYAATLPGDHQYIASALTGLARTLIEEKHPEEAYAAATRALSIWRASLPPDHPQIANAQAAAAQALALQGEDAKAEPMLLASYQRLHTAFDPTDPRVQTAARWLAELYRRTNRATLADALQAPPR